MRFFCLPLVRKTTLPMLTALMLLFTLPVLAFQQQDRTVKGKVTDDKKMYKGKVQIKNDANNFVMAEMYYETHYLLEMNYRLAYKAEVTAPTDFSILIEFQDHGANTSTATIKVKVDP